MLDPAQGVRGVEGLAVLGVVLPGRIGQQLERASRSASEFSVAKAAYSPGRHVAQVADEVHHLVVAQQRDDPPALLRGLLLRASSAGPSPCASRGRGRARRRSGRGRSCRPTSSPSCRRRPRAAAPGRTPRKPPWTSPTATMRSAPVNTACGAGGCAACRTGQGREGDDEGGGAEAKPRRSEPMARDGRPGIWPGDRRAHHRRVTQAGRFAGRCKESRGPVLVSRRTTMTNHDRPCCSLWHCDWPPSPPRPSPPAAASTSRCWSTDGPRPSTRHAARGTSRPSRARSTPSGSATRWACASPSRCRSTA